ncbi:MAG TPA: hybrid sensor histidine kinase/response regulator, partial [Polyangiaceae bacterium]|nr:hybrid sensor histidine kinase/response regulator [Polyangiaceae bacterium]
MNQSVFVRRLEALRLLGERVARESSGGLLGDALDALATATGACSCLAFGVDGAFDPIAERTNPLAPDLGGQALKRAVHRLAGSAAASRQALAGVRAEVAHLPEGQAVLAAGFEGVLVQPVCFRRSVLAVLLCLFDDASNFDSGVVPFTTTVANLVALGLQNEQRAELDRTKRERLSASGAPGVGVLSSAVAHELGGPASALALQWDELRHAVDQLGHLAGSDEGPLGAVTRELGELSQEMGVALGKLRETADRLLAVGRRESSPQHVDVSLLARRSIVVARTLLEERGVPLDEHYERDCLTLGRRDELEQVVLNLLVNAAEAASRSEQPRIWLRVQGDPQHILLTVEDSGPGVPPELVESIFQPFFTTKAEGRGAGLGLKIVSEVVAAHGGHIEVHQRAGGGASFRVVLPRARVADNNVQHTPLPSRDDDGDRRVFVVDDDPIFSRTLSRGLKPHEVRTAASASEAEMILLDPSYEPDLVVCDVFLLGANGDALHQRIRARRPELASRFVFVTGAALGGREAE